MFRIPLVVAAAITAGVPAPAPDQGPAAGYPPLVNVRQYLDRAPEAGAKVAVFGFPQCGSVAECILRERPGLVSERLHFDAANLPSLDQQRLLHCDDHDHEQCIIVLYGRAAPDTIIAETIWWRSTLG